jgi:creatinine amidohydrolase
MSAEHAGREAAQSLLGQRIASIPEALREVLRAPLPSELWTIARAPRFVITGGGFSEGPARVLATLLARAGRCARYLPLSHFAAPQLAKSDSVLILFSQGLAPNARLPLAHAQSFAKTLVFTSVGATQDAGSEAMRALRDRLEQRGVIFFSHPPIQEDRLLVRVVGPAAALAAIARFIDLFPQASTQRLASRPPLAKLADHYAAALERPQRFFVGEKQPLAIVTGGDFCELAFPLRWKLLEGLRISDPPIWDFLQVIHGPLQAFYDAPMTLVSIEREAQPESRALIDRLATLIDPSRHQLVRFTVPRIEPAETPTALLSELLLLDAAWNAALLETIAAQSINLADWPLRNRDGALYEIDPETLKLRGLEG